MERTNAILLSRVARGAAHLAGERDGFTRVRVEGLRHAAELTDETIRTLLKLGVDVRLEAAG